MGDINGTLEAKGELILPKDEDTWQKPPSTE
jgi:hypothetical protein